MSNKKFTKIALCIITCTTGVLLVNGLILAFAAYVCSNATLFDVLTLTFKLTSGFWAVVLSAILVHYKRLIA